jgi:hypothetical protein
MTKVEIVNIICFIIIWAGVFIGRFFNNDTVYMCVIVVQVAALCLQICVYLYDLSNKK